MATRDETPPARLLEALYAGVADVAAWNRFLLAFADHMGASRAVLLLTRVGEDRPREILSPGSDRHRAALYVDRHFATDPFVGLPQTRVVSFGEFLSRRSAGEVRAIRAYLSETVGNQILGVDMTPAPAWSRGSGSRGCSACPISAGASGGGWRRWCRTWRSRSGAWR
ncbi:hypothetical protein ACFSTI_14100 [Rhizorhabdus histidinilytica]